MRTPSASTAAVLAALVLAATMTALLIAMAVTPSSSAGADPEGGGEPAPAATSPAAEEASAYRLVSLQGSNFRVASRSCRSVDVRFRYVNPRDSDHGITVEVDVWKGRRYQDQAFVYANRGLASDKNVGVGGRYLWCPDQGLGSFRLGPSRVEGNSYSGESQAVAFGDRTVGHFTAKLDSRTALAIAPAGSPSRRVRVTAVVANYMLRTATYQRWPGRLVRIQRRDADGWTVIGFARTDRRGVASTTVVAPVGARLRARTFGTDYVWGSLSSTRATARS